MHRLFLRQINKSTKMANAFRKTSDELSNRTPNKIQLDKGSKFYNKSMK